MEPTAQTKTSGITMKDKIGYALGDFGGLLFFSMAGSFLQMFYTDVLRIPLEKIMVLFVVVRIWDGINDPICGTIIDRRRAGRHGKFRPYLRTFSIPVALAGVLVFTRIPGLSELQYLLYAYITHILYEGLYTFINVPYGSMLSVITDEASERSQLSIARTIGSGLGGLPAMVLMPFFVFSATAAGSKYLDGNKLFFAVLIFAVCTAAALMASFKMTKERIPPPAPAKTEKPNVAQTVKILLRNKPFLVLCFASMLLIGVQFYTQTVYNYLYKDYFNQPSLYGLVSVATYAPTALLILFLNKLVTRFGKKMLCAYGLLLSAAVNVAALALHTDNPYLFLAFCFLSGFGATFLVMEIWALVVDVIDYQEILSHKREEGTCYSFFSFTRKLGQTLAGSGSTFVLAKIGYEIAQNDAAVIQASAVAEKMYTIATLIPAIVYFLMFISLAFLYPLGKKEEESMREELRQRRAQEG